MQLAPRALFALDFMLFLKPFLTRQAHAQHAAERAPSPEYLQASTVNDEVDRGLLVRPWTRLQYHAVPPARQG